MTQSSLVKHFTDQITSDLRCSEHPPRLLRDQAEWDERRPSEDLEEKAWSDEWEELT